LKPSVARIEALIWTLIYGGLLAVGVGIALARDGAPYGFGVVIAAAVVVAIGIALVWVRSRLHTP
jgi:uncharacterized protein (DUF697 family)